MLDVSGIISIVSGSTLGELEGSVDDGVQDSSTKGHGIPTCKHFKVPIVAFKFKIMV
jgi:hypothetical protein